MSLVDIHKKQLRKRRRLRHSKSTSSTATAATTATFQSSSSGFARIGSNTSSGLSSSEMPGRRGRRGKRCTSSVGTNSTTLNSNNSLVLPEAEVSNPDNISPLATASKNLYGIEANAKIPPAVEETGAAALPLESPKLKHILLTDVSELPDHPVLNEVACLAAVQDVQLVEAAGENEIMRFVDDDDERKKFHRFMSMDMEDPEEEYDEDEDDGEEMYVVGDIDDMEYLENITSCNKVENVVMLSEYEQNLLKECEDVSEAGAAARYPMRNKKGWFKKQGPPSTAAVLKHKNKRWNQVLPGPSRAITTIEEHSTAGNE